MERISDSKGFEGIEFDTYIPSLGEPADITEALKMFYFGSTIDGEDYLPDSIYAHLLRLADAEVVQEFINTHISASSGVHGLLPDGGVVVGTQQEQVLTNKTLTSPQITNPKINEASAVLTATSTELNVLDGVNITTQELNYLKGTSGSIQFQLNNIIDILSRASVVGEIKAYAGNTAPNGYLLCHGQALNTYTYRDLHAVISNNFGGTAYQAGVTDVIGATTFFYAPDLRGRVIAGVDNMGGLDSGRLDWSNSIGTTGGSQRTALTQAELPVFNHEYQVSKGGAVTGTYFQIVNGTYETSYFYGHGSGQAHNNMQPTMVLNYIIKF